MTTRSQYNDVVVIKQLLSFFPTFHLPVTKDSSLSIPTEYEHKFPVASAQQLNEQRSTTIKELIKASKCPSAEALKKCLNQVKTYMDLLLSFQDIFNELNQVLIQEPKNMYEWDTTPILSRTSTSFEAVNYANEVLMMHVCDAISRFNMARVLVQSATNDEPEDTLPTAARFLREAAGIFDYTQILINEIQCQHVNGMDAQILLAAKSICLALTQQLSILKGLNTSPLGLMAKLHLGAHEFFKSSHDLFRVHTPVAALTSETTSLLGYCSFYSRIHKAEAEFLMALLEYEKSDHKAAITRISVAKTLYKQREFVAGEGIPSTNVESVANAVSSRRSSVVRACGDWERDNRSAYFVVALPADELKKIEPIIIAKVIAVQRKWKKW